MDEMSQLVNTISLTMGAAWASGINLYAAILVLGILGTTGNIVLPENLEILMNPWVMGAAGLMYLVEFFADKVPGLDTTWDSVHTFIRVPAGAILAAAAVGEVNPALAIAAGIVGGGLAAGTHATKAGSRIMINTSPEPFSNWTVSALEDIAVIAGIWTALHYPWVFISFLILFIIFMIWLLPKIWGGIKKVFSWLAGLFGAQKPDSADTPPTNNI